MAWLRENRMHIINGETTEDAEGEFTYIGGGGTSTEDYVIIGEMGRNTGDE